MVYSEIYFSILVLPKCTIWCPFCDGHWFVRNSKEKGAIQVVWITVFNDCNSNDYGIALTYKYVEIVNNSNWFIIKYFPKSKKRYSKIEKKQESV